MCMIIVNHNLVLRDLESVANETGYCDADTFKSLLGEDVIRILRNDREVIAVDDEVYLDGVRQSYSTLNMVLEAI